ncbi:acetylornithine aminotransferase [Polyrhizophydium stewartii]|uniref:acetylornithine transaminase n=1 Tax=Polyrhizophydium stewartii TaxID=2732419 RepID=A0ABR4N7E3_9FUNG
MLRARAAAAAALAAAAAAPARHRSPLARPLSTSLRVRDPAQAQPRPAPHPPAHHADQPLQTQAQVNDQIARDADVLLQLYARPNIVFSHGSGAVLFDTQGRRYLDFTAGIAVNALGHADPGVAAVVADQASKLVHLSNLYHHEHAGPLARMIVDGVRAAESACVERGAAERLGAAKVFFCNSGTEANEAAIKFARKFAQYTSGGASKFNILSFENAFHGRTMGALSATPTRKYQEPFVPLLPGFAKARLNDISSLDTLITEDTCAVIVEPLQGEGGIHEAKPEFLAAVRARCDAVGALLIFDEIQCGVGRTGTMFAFEHAGVVPDVVSLAKPLASGLPIGAVIVSERVAACIKPGDHGTTFGGSPFATRVGAHTWRTISSPEFLAAVQRAGVHLRARMLELKDASPLIVDVRGRGLIQGIAFRENVDPQMFVRLARERGVLLVSAGCNTIRLIPPLIVSLEQIDRAAEVFEEVLGIMEGVIGSGKDL